MHIFCQFKSRANKCIEGLKLYIYESPEKQWKENNPVEFKPGKNDRKGKEANKCCSHFNLTRT